MKPKENIEEFVKLEKPRVQTGDTMDRRTLNDSFAAMDETIRARRPNAARIILHNKAAKLAAAAVIIVAIGLLMIYRNPSEPQDPSKQTASVPKSPADMLSAMSLNLAWRRGGMEAIDEQSDKAFEMLGTKPAETTIEELRIELNGV
jgi:hypothetical protein